MSRITGIPYSTIACMKSRNRVSRTLADVVGGLSFFVNDGFTSQSLRPDLMWLDSAVGVK